MLRDEPIKARPVSRLERTWRWCRRNPALAATGSVAILAVLVLATALSVPRPPGRVLRRVRLQTVPAGAALVFHPLAVQTGEPQPELTVRLPHARADGPAEDDLEPGDYLVVAVAQTPGYSFHEVYRRVPDVGMTPGVYPHDSWQDGESGIVVLSPILIPRDSVTTGMAFFAGGERVPIGAAGSTEVPLHERTVPGFWLDPTEVRVGDYATVSPNDRVFQYYDEESLPRAADTPIAYVPWDLAVRYAEVVEKRLPTEWEYEYAATKAGTRKFPWGNDDATITDGGFGPAGQPAWDRTDTAPPVAGLFSNLAEWTSSWPTLYPFHQQAGFPVMDLPGDERIVRGAPYSAIEGQPSREDWRNADPRLRIAQPRKTWRRGMGFRCARSARPRLDVLDFSRPQAGQND